MDEKRRLGFFEIADGQCGRQMQDEFEQAQLTAQAMNGKVKVALMIEVNPPEPDQLFGHIDYSISTRSPKYGGSCTTQLQGGIAVKQAKSEDDLRQCVLDLPMPVSNITHMTFKTGKAE